jgi:POT family proton-dependent oligopeptide transporter
MWERFSYYGMRSLLTLYMVEYLFLKPEVGREVLGFNAVRSALEGAYGPLETQPLASHIYGLYTGFVYFTPFFGGLLADRVLGQRRTVIIGAILMAIGHFLMAFEGLFFLALLFLIFGNGAFKPNISTQVGSLYPEGDPRRDGAFTIFYMGINLGAFFSPIVCGTLGQKVGWHYGFSAAGVGMLVGLAIYLWGQKYLGRDNLTKGKVEEGERVPLTDAEWKGIGALIVLCALNIVFWGVYEQQGNTMQLWADNHTDWHIVPELDWELGSTLYQSFNPAMIVLFAPLLDRFWRRQGERAPSSVTKMAIGCMLLGLAFVVMIIGAQSIGDGVGSVWWLVGMTFVLTIGELYLSPIGLSLVTKVAPVRMVSMMMGMWFLSSFFGNYLSGYLGAFWEKMPKESFFLMLTVLGVGTGLVMLAINRPLKRAIGHKV